MDLEFLNAPSDDPVTCLIWWQQTDGGANGGVGARKFEGKPIAGRQTVLLDMLAPGDLFDPWAGTITQLRIEAPWEYDPSNSGSSWASATTQLHRIEISHTLAKPEYPQVSSWGQHAAGYDSMQWPGNRFVNRRSLYTVTQSNELWGLHNLYHPNVIRTDDTAYPYKMWFMGWATADSNPGFPGSDAIWHARSADRINWQVYKGSGNWDTTMTPSTWVPVLTAETKIYDNWHNGDASVVLHNGTYYMAYSATGYNADGDGVAMGCAEKDQADFADGTFDVLFAGEKPMLSQWPNPTVIKAGDKYYSFADPSGHGDGWAGRQIAEAESDDGISWTITGYIPSDSDTPANQVPEVTLIDAADGQTWLVVYYACQIGGDPYDYRYNRIRSMKRAPRMGLPEHG